MQPRDYTPQELQRWRQDDVWNHPVMLGAQIAVMFGALAVLVFEVMR